MYRNAESSGDFVPYDQVKDTLSRTELLKSANANVYSFLPSWADDKYFMHLYKPKTIKGNGIETNMKAENSILKKEEIDEGKTKSQSDRANEESVNDMKGESTREILKGEIKLESERTAVDEEVENSQIPATCTGPEMISQVLHTKTEDVAAYTRSIIQTPITGAHQSTTVRTLQTLCKSVKVETKNVNTSNVSQENDCTQKPTLLQDELLCMAERYPEEEPCISGCFSVLTMSWQKWKKRIQRFFGFER
jgi:hypothetical protein